MRPTFKIDLDLDAATLYGGGGNTPFTLDCEAQAEGCFKIYEKHGWACLFQADQIKLVNKYKVAYTVRKFQEERLHIVELKNEIADVELILGGADSTTVNNGTKSQKSREAWFKAHLAELKGEKAILDARPEYWVLRVYKRNVRMYWY
jgi:hypothetical protein